MKKLILSLCLLALVCWSAAVIAASATTPEALTPQEVEAAPVETTPEVVEIEATIPALCEVSTSMFNPNYCGDPCSNEGAMVGCIDTSGPVWRRLICTCSSGYLVC